MKSKLIQGNESRLLFYCPGCKSAHTIPVTGERSWQWNGDFEKPTVNPSFRAYLPAMPGDGTYLGHPEKTLCHVIITEGVLNFCGDNPHEFNAKSVPMVDLEDYGWDKE